MSEDFNDECMDSEYVTCPHCGTDIFIDEAYEYGLEEKEEDHECSACEQPFTLKCSRIVHKFYFSAKKEVHGN